MNVYLTFDVEIWCGGWQNLDTRFPSSFERYVYGRSKHGEYALPKTLEILDKHRLHGIFFIEPLFAARFGVEHLAVIVDLVRQAGQEVQLHIHPEWTDEIRPLPFPGATHKRQHLSYYSQEEQEVLLTLGKKLLNEAGCQSVQAFRAGSFAANADTYKALANCGISIDSSLNRCHAVSAPDLRDTTLFDQPSEIDGVTQLPVTVFHDGLGRFRPAQVGACSFMEMREALESALQCNKEHFVAVSHSFEMLRPDSLEPDSIVVRRFEALCDYLDRQRSLYQTAGLDNRPLVSSSANVNASLKVSRLATGKRLVEQAIRRVVAWS